MSDDRRTRRRFLADMLFAGGAVTAASVLGYVTTHTTPEPPPPAIPSFTPTPQCNLDIQPEGKMAVPNPQVVIPIREPEIRPGGKPVAR